MIIARPRRTAVTLAVTALLLTGCRLPFSAEAQFLEQSSREMAEVAFAEMRGLESVRVIGNADVRGVNTRIDLQMDDRGNCKGSLDSAHGSVQLRANEQGSWVKVDEAPGTKWTKPPPDARIDKMCDLGNLMSDFTLDETDTEDSLLKGEVEQIGEQEAIPIEGDNGKRRTTAWISLSSPHRVVKMAPADDPHGQEVVFFDDFDSDFVVETPAE